jgi:hypothetical protein
MYPVRRISSEVVKTCLLEKFFPGYGVPQSIVSGNAAVFKSRTFYNLCFLGEFGILPPHPITPSVSGSTL